MCVCVGGGGGTKELIHVCAGDLGITTCVLCKGLNTCECGGFEY